ncbi:hypothetical protein [Robinsoniella sp. KNHs210]|uniref:hypothetical protein n=1 Tax=Robinsoniella sp. KNHs210 TaxID=1469950 RepID=UPI000485B4D7|nr:hypothetical protein [Robinsoniella sp. KNHs210]
MSRKRDITTKSFLSDPVVFCDLYNGALFDGEQILRPGELRQLNGESALLVPDSRGKKRQKADSVMWYSKPEFVGGLRCWHVKFRIRFILLCL